MSRDSYAEDLCEAVSHERTLKAWPSLTTCCTRADFLHSLFPANYSRSSSYGIFMAACAVYALKKLLRTLRSPSRYITVDHKFPSGTSLGELNSANIMD